MKGAPPWKVRGGPWQVRGMRGKVWGGQGDRFSEGKGAGDYVGGGDGKREED